MLQRALARNPILQQRLNVLGHINPPLLENPSLLKARKNLDLPTACIYLLNSEKYKKLSPKAIKQLLSKHTKKKPFDKMSLGSKISRTFSKILASRVKRFSYYNTDSEDSEFKKSEIKLLKLLASSYKHLEHLDATKLDIQNKPSLARISKLNHLQSLIMKLHLGKRLPSPRFFQNLKNLQHLTLSISESSQIKESDLATLEGVFHSLALLPSLESFHIEIHSSYSEQSENFIGAVFYDLTLLKANRFSVKIHCSEALNLKFETFSSFLENIDTLEYKYSGSLQNERTNFHSPTSKKLTLILKPSHPKKSFQSIFNTCCNSLENLSLEQSAFSIPPSALKLPQTLKTLTLRFSTLHLIVDLPQFLKAWEALLSSLNNLENLSLVLNNSDEATQQWISQLTQRVPLKSLKQYHLNLRGEYLPQSGVQVEYDSSLTEWSRSLYSLGNLEGLSLDINFILLKSLNFFTDALASLPRLKSIKLNLFLKNSQQKETLEFCLPSESLSKLEHIWLGFSQYVSKDSSAKLLQDIAKCENLQSFNISGLGFNEKNAISTLKGLAHLKELEIEIDTGDILTINSKKEIIKHKAGFFKRRMAS